MCGRFVQASDPDALVRHFALEEWPTLALVPRYNIAPTQPVAVVRADGGRRLALLRWGLVPPWTKDLRSGPPLFNARSETAADKPAFRAALRRRRCLVPASGFYEWQKMGKAKQPFLIRLRDGGLFAFAGLWERWQGEGEAVESVAVLTTAANELMRPLHDRMPVILDPGAYARWLSEQDPEALRPLLAPCPDGRLTATPVSSYVNNARHEGPQCLEPAP